MQNEEDVKLAETIWDFLKLDHTIAKSDLILVFGNPDIRTAKYASKLWLDGLATWFMVSGKEGTSTKGKWDKPEARVFKDIAISEGVSEDKILLEEEATNTGQNVVLSYQILQQQDILDSIKRIILVQMPFMERRTYATFLKQWPGGIDKLDSVIITSPDTDFLSYPNEDVGNMNKIIEMMLGCLHRVKTYPDLGFQVAQEIPKNVWTAGQRLLSNGRYVVT